jgi:hypothetical protein
MHAHGSDRVRRGKGEQWVIFCRHGKGWTARVPRTYTSAEHPGTAILWEEQYFEVVDAQPVPGGVRYVLEPWRENNAMRLTDAYDAPSENRREAEQRAAVGREKGRKAANLAGILTGHLPAAVQEKLASDLGILPTRLTVLSLIAPLLYEIWLVNESVRRMMVNDPGLPLVLTLIGGYLGLESVIRLNIVWTQMRPIGSAAGWILYMIYYGLSPNRAHLANPMAVPRGESIQTTAAPPDVALSDAFTLREPFLTLLAPPDQKRLTQKFGFDHRANGYKVAGILLVFSIAGVVSSLVTLSKGASVSALTSLILAMIIAGEQVLRIPAMRRGPAGSILGVLVRPFARKLLD